MRPVVWNSNWSIGRRVVITAFLFVVVSLTLYACDGSNSASENSNTLDSAEQAQAFELPDQFGETYSFTPGDGRDHIFVFYMGYF